MTQLIIETFSILIDTACVIIISLKLHGIISFWDYIPSSKCFEVSILRFWAAEIENYGKLGILQKNFVAIANWELHGEFILESEAVAANINLRFVWFHTKVFL